MPQPHQPVEAPWWKHGHVWLIIAGPARPTMMEMKTTTTISSTSVKPAERNEGLSWRRNATGKALCKERTPSCNGPYPWRSWGLELPRERGAARIRCRATKTFRGVVMALGL